MRVVAPDGTVVKEISRFIGTRTNNQAEYEGLICALLESRQLGSGAVVIRTDSELLYYQMSGEYKVRNPHLRALHSKARELTRELHNVRLELVRREQNEDSDRLAKAAAQAADDHPRHAP